MQIDQRKRMLTRLPGFGWMKRKLLNKMQGMERKREGKGDKGDGL